MEIAFAAAFSTMILQLVVCLLCFQQKNKHIKAK
jgi:hypothetical protein